MAILKRIFQFVLGLALTFIGFPSQNSILESLCYQFVCDYPLTELPQTTCRYCHTASMFLFILGILSLVMFVFGLAKDLVKSVEQKPKESAKGLKY